VRLHWGFKVLASVLALVAIASFLLVLLIQGLPQQEAAGQEPTVPVVTVPPAYTPAAGVPEPVPFPELTEGLPSEPKPEGIPGLSVMEVIGNLEHFHAEGRFACDGPVPTDVAKGNMWVCSSSGDELPGTYELTVVGEDPATIFWVAATARGVSEEQAAEFFSYIAGLCLQKTDPLNPEAWVEQHVDSGEEMFTEGAQLSVYGTKEERTLQVVATGFATD